MRGDTINKHIRKFEKRALEYKVADHYGKVLASTKNMETLYDDLVALLEDLKGETWSV